MTALLPPGSCDCHVHLIGPASAYPFAPERVYTPGDASEAELLAMHRRIGISRIVVVQPSIYGTDNRRTLDALKRLGAGARAVAVVSAKTSADELDRLHEAGVRGVKLNVATSGQDDPEAAWQQLCTQAGMVARLGWHVQVHARLQVLAALASRLPDLAVPLVIDHFGLLKPEAGLEQPGFRQLLDLLAGGRILLKLSAIERLTGAGKGAALAPFITALVRANPAGLVWGSDWPHTGGARHEADQINVIEPFEPLDDALAIAVMLDAVQDASLRQAIFVDTPARLYDFPPQVAP